MVTIFTPTYNRAYILSELYESLKGQKCKDFEWIIVDDESTDNTEELIKNFRIEGVKISYFKQKHGGKHRAINLGLQYAKGEYFFIVDSDDHLTSDAVLKVKNWTSEITEQDTKICGVSGMRISKSDVVFGGGIEVNDKGYIEAGNLERAGKGLLGDKSEVYRTSVLRKFPFPEYDGEFFITEAVVWDNIAMNGYKLRWYNDPIYVCEYLDDGLTKNGANDLKGYLENFKGFSHYIKIEIKANSFINELDYYLKYNHVAKLKGLSFRQRADMLEVKFSLYLLKSFMAVVKKIMIKFKNIWR